MDDPADAMEIVEAFQDLGAYLLADIKRDSLVVTLLYYFQQVATQDLKHHTKMVSIAGAMHKGIQQTHHMGIISRFPLPVGVIVAAPHFLEDLDFVQGGLHVMRRALLDFDSHI